MSKLLLCQSYVMPKLYYVMVCHSYIMLCQSDVTSNYVISKLFYVNVMLCQSYVILDQSNVMSSYNIMSKLCYVMSKLY
jgi:hypothetical protein